MRLNDIKEMTCDFLTPSDVASVLQCSPQTIRIIARENPQLLGFNVCTVGNRTKIPRLAFIKWMEGYDHRC